MTYRQEESVAWIIAESDVLKGRTPHAVRPVIPDYMQRKIWAKA